MFRLTVRSRAKLTRRARWALALSAVLALTACGGSSDFGPAGGSGAPTSSESALSSLPADAQKAYENADALTGKTPYTEGWKPKGPPPWTIGYASPYAGNSWQTTAMDHLMNDVVPRYQKAGLIKEVIVAQSGGDDTVQNQQIRQLVDQGVDILIACCSAKTALNQSIEYAHEKGVPFVAWSGHVDSPYAVSAVTNYRQAGSVFAKSVFDKIGGKGNVLDVQGVPGATNAIDFEAGVQDALKEYPDIKLVGSVNGMWSAPVTKTEVQKFLATHPGQLDGIVAQPASATGRFAGPSAIRPPRCPDQHWWRDGCRVLLGEPSRVCGYRLQHLAAQGRNGTWNRDGCPDPSAAGTKNTVHRSDRLPDQLRRSQGDSGGEM